jgi:4-amino-4-deoxy-L-arabinose transferase-like glycosyltransferase
MPVQSVALEKPGSLAARVRDRLTAKVDGAIVLLLLVLGAFQIATVQRLESFGSDSSVYITLARNILENGHYEFNFRPETLYPPGFPALLACVAGFAGSASYGVFVRVMPVFTTLALVVWYFVLKEDAGRFAAGASCLLVATSAPLFEMATRRVGSDAPFFLASGLALWCLLDLERRDARAHGWPGFLLFLGTLLFTAAAVLIRSCGIALSAAMLAWALAARWRRGPARQIARRCAVSAALAAIIIFILWIGWSKHANQEYPGEHMGSYASQFAMRDPHRPGLGKASAGEVLIRLVSKLPVQSSHLVATFTRIPWVAPDWYSPLIVIPISLLAAGIVSCVLENRAPLLGGYFLAYFAIYLAWPFDEGARFMLPVAPLAFVLMWWGVVSLERAFRAKPAALCILISILAAVLCVVSFIYSQPGLQARAAKAFWLGLAGMTALFAVLAARSGPDGTAVPLDWSARLMPRVPMKAILVVVGAVGVFQQAAMSRTNLAPDVTSFRHYRSFDCALWLRTAGQGVVMAQQAAILHRLTGRRIANFPVSSDPEVVIAAVKREDVRYLVVNNHLNAEDEYFYPPEQDRYSQIERAYPRAFQLAHNGNGYRVFEYRP